MLRYNRLMPPLRAQCREVLCDALKRQSVKRVGRAMVDVSAQYQFSVCGR